MSKTPKKERPQVTGRPITPREAKEEQPKVIPPTVYDVFNNLLRARIADKDIIIITQDEVMKAILSRMPEVKRQEVFDNHWLDIEDVYIKAGWEVEFEKPAYNESGASFWTFSHGKVYVDGR